VSRSVLPLAVVASLTLVVAGGVVLADGAVLEGRVRTDEGLALADAHVYVRRDEALVAEAVTDGRGRFRIELDASEPVDVLAGKSYRDEDGDGRARYFTLDVRASDVVPGRARLDLVARRDPDEGVVRVRVTSPEGNVDHAFVQTRPALFPPEAARWWPAKATNAIGRADCTGLPLLPAEVRVERRAPWCPALVRDVLPDPLGIDLCRIELERERDLEGYVRDGAGAPVAGIGVLAAPTGPGTARSWGDVTGLDGAFEIGVPRSWERATLLVGCDVPTEESPHRLALEIRTTQDAAKKPIEVVFDRPLPQPGEPADEASRHVMETVLRAHYVREDRGPLVLVRQLGRTMASEPASTYLGEAVKDSTWRDLERRSRTPATLPPDLDLGVQQVVIEGAWNGYLDRIYDLGVWRHFYRRFPGSNGLVILSCVGFSDDGTQAVLHVAHLRWNRNADGFYYLLEKQDDTWRIVTRAMTWIS